MPRAAIATGMVDMVLSPPEIAHQVVADGRRIPTSASSCRRSSDELSRARRSAPAHFRSAATRQRHRLQALQAPDDQTAAAAPHGAAPADRRAATTSGCSKQTPGEMRALYQDLLIHVTRFFREPESFKALAAAGVSEGGIENRRESSRFAPGSRDARPARRPIRWRSRCSSTCMARHLDVPDPDLCHRRERHGDRARACRTLPGEHRGRRVRRTSCADSSRKSDGSYRVSKSVRDLCVFARQDLTKDPPFSRLDLILCRNVLIYMDVVLQQRLISVFHYALNPNGSSCSGRQRPSARRSGLFSLTDKKFRIYRKKTSPACRRCA